MGEGLLVLPGFWLGRGANLEVFIWGLVLALLIIYYNYRHKTDPLSPLVMALCRALVYPISAAMVATASTSQVLAGKPGAGRLRGRTDLCCKTGKSCRAEKRLALSLFVGTVCLRVPPIGPTRQKEFDPFSLPGLGHLHPFLPIEAKAKHPSDGNRPDCRDFPVGWNADRSRSRANCRGLADRRSLSAYLILSTVHPGNVTRPFPHSTENHLQLRRSS